MNAGTNVISMMPSNVPEGQFLNLILSRHGFKNIREYAGRVIM
jgi:hypothetical protein